METVEEELDDEAEQAEEEEEEEMPTSASGRGWTLSRTCCCRGEATFEFDAKGQRRGQKRCRRSWAQGERRH